MAAPLPRSDPRGWIPRERQRQRVRPVRAGHAAVPHLLFALDLEVTPAREAVAQRRELRLQPVIPHGARASAAVPGPLGPRRSRQQVEEPGEGGDPEALGDVAGSRTRPYSRRGGGVQERSGDRQEQPAEAEAYADGMLAARIARGIVCPDYEGIH